MFIGGLNWETTDGERLLPNDFMSDLLTPSLESLKNYFTQFGEVLECTVMRDGATGRSRGFGFLTFKDPKTVNIVMVKEHHLDGKIVSFTWLIAKTIQLIRPIDRSQAGHSSRRAGAHSQDLCWRSEPRMYRAVFQGVLHEVWTGH